MLLAAGQWNQRVGEEKKAREPFGLSEVSLS